MSVRAPERALAGKRGRIFYGWWIVLGAFVLQASNSALFFNSFQVYFVHLRDEFGWTRSQIAAAFSLSRAESGLLGPLQGWMVDKFGPRALMRIGTVLFAVGFFLFAWMDSIWQFYGAYLVISIGSSLGGFLTINASLANWFDRKRSTAMGLASTGWGSAGLLVPVVAVVMGIMGWRETAFWSGILVLLIGLPVAQLFRHSPEPYGYLPDGAKPQHNGVDAESDGDSLVRNVTSIGVAPASYSFTVKQALRSPAFWFISFGHASAMFSVSAVNALFIPHLDESLGISTVVGATIFTVLTAVSVVGQGITGFLGDRFEKRKIIVLCMFGHTIALGILVFASTVPMLVLFAIVHGVSWGFRGPLMTAIRAEYFGRASFGKIMGFSSLVIQIGTMSGPLVGAAIADATGKYTNAFAFIAVFTTIGAGLFFLARKPPAPLPPSLAGGAVPSPITSHQ